MLVLALCATLGWTEVIEVASEVRVRLGVTERVWVALDADIPHLDMWVDAYQDGFLISVHPRIMQWSIPRVRRGFLHETCHILYDRDVLDRWAQLPDAEIQSRHRAVRRCVEFSERHWRVP